MWPRVVYFERSHVHPVDPFKAQLLKMPSRRAICFSCAAKRRAVRRWKITESFRGTCHTCYLLDQNLGWLDGI